jgi:hypothetical protein
MLLIKQKNTLLFPGDTLLRFISSVHRLQAENDALLFGEYQVVFIRQEP